MIRLLYFTFYTKVNHQQNRIFHNNIKRNSKFEVIMDGSWQLPTVPTIWYKVIVRRAKGYEDLLGDVIQQRWSSFGCKIKRGSLHHKMFILFQRRYHVSGDQATRFAFQ